jgi:hypothetical protein
MDGMALVDVPANHAKIANEEKMVWGFLARVGVTTKYSKDTKGEDDRARTRRSGTRFDGLRASGDLTEAQNHGGEGSQIQETI